MAIVQYLLPALALAGTAFGESNTYSVVKLGSGDP